MVQDQEIPNKFGDERDMKPTWSFALNATGTKVVLADVKTYISNELKKGRKIYPPVPEMFNALKLTPLENVNVVIIGQDPYHGEGQAMGLSFSVKDGITIPPSLRNIYTELETDIGISRPKTGDLTPWAKQGVLLLNASLSVEEKRPNSHAEIGWRVVTNQIVKTVSEFTTGTVFLLWGAFAQGFEPLVDLHKHHVLKCPHPSPFSASRGFFGCKHFSKTNELLVAQNKKPINWQI